MRRCGHCYGRGHNRRSCPVIRKEIKDNPNGYQARIARTKKEHVSRNPRKCSYCKETGHNKATCSSLSQDRGEQATKATIWRQDFIAQCQQQGFSIGTLVKFCDQNHVVNEWAKNRQQEYRTKYGEYGMVIALDSPRLDHRQCQRSVSSMSIRFPCGTTRQFVLPREFANLMDTYASPFFEIAAKIDSLRVYDLFPHTWHNGTDTADYHLNL
jgi:hypothetical protein